MDTHAVFTATVLAAIVGTLVMAVYAKKPFGLAPGMGLNAFFVFTVCLTMGYPWQMALTAVLIEGFIFIILSATGIRSLMVDAIPASLKRAIGAGIGLFIAFIGLKNAGIVAANAATLVTIGKITEGSALLGAIGIVITSVLVIKKVPGSLLIGIIATTLIGTFGKKRVQWALVITGLVVGLAMFFEVGFVLLLPLVFTVVASSGLPLLYVGVPMVAALSVAHCFLPPHPGHPASHRWPARRCSPRPAAVPDDRYPASRCAE